MDGDGKCTGSFASGVQGVSCGDPGCGDPGEAGPVPLESAGTLMQSLSRSGP